MRTFRFYRRGDISATHTAGTMNAPDEVQFEGIEFSDGTTVIRWCTAFRSTSVFARLADLFSIHGHPEYNTVVEFSDGFKMEGQPDGTWKYST